MMEQEMYYQTAEDALQQSTYIGCLLSFLLVLYNCIEATLHQYETIGIQMHDRIISLRTIMPSIMKIIRRVLFLMRWIISYGELALLYAKDLSIFIRRCHCFLPKSYRRLSDIDRENSYSWFGLNPNDLRRLYVA